VARVDELFPSGRSRVGGCTVVSDGTYDELREGGRLVMRGGEAKPLIAFDPRIPGPAGLRVGMTGADIAEILPHHRHVACHAFDRSVQCELRRDAGPPTCADDPEDTIYVELDRPAGMHDEVEGAAAWDLLRARPLTAVILTMPC
jgi:hypothetical protein